MSVEFARTTTTDAVYPMFLGERTFWEQRWHSLSGDELAWDITYHVAEFALEHFRDRLDERTSDLLEGIARLRPQLNNNESNAQKRYIRRMASVIDNMPFVIPVDDDHNKIPLFFETKIEPTRAMRVALSNRDDEAHILAISRTALARLHQEARSLDAPPPTMTFIYQSVERPVSVRRDSPSASVGARAPLLADRVHSQSSCECCACCYDGTAKNAACYIGTVLCISGVIWGSVLAPIFIMTDE